LDDPINLKTVWKLAHYVADAFGVPVPVNQSGVGANVFTHEIGIHADGALKDRYNKEAEITKIALVKKEKKDELQ